MKAQNLKELSTAALVERFAEIGVAQDRAIFSNDNKTFNRLFDRMVAVEQELKSRPGDQRRALMALYQNSNMQVRLNAARATLAVAPIEARQMLESIAESGWHPQAGDAGMSISNLDRGIYKPT